MMYSPNFITFHDILYHMKLFITITDTSQSFVNVCVPTVSNFFVGFL